MGKKRKHQSDYDLEDIQGLKRQLQKARNKGDFQEVANFVNLIGVACRQHGDYEQALEYHDEEIGITKKYLQTDKIALAVAYRAKAEVYIEMNDEKEALPLVKEYLRLSTEQKDVIEEQRARITLGRVYLGISHKCAEDNSNITLKMKALEKAEAEFRKARDLLDHKILKSQQTDASITDMKCGVFINIAIVLELKGQLEECKRFFLKAVELGRKHSLYDNIYRSCLNLCEVYSRLDDYTEARRSAEEAGKAARSLGSKGMEAEARFLEAKMLFLLDDVSSAVKLLKKLRKQMQNQAQKFTSQNIQDDLELFLRAGVRIQRTEDALHYTNSTEFGKKRILLERLADNYVKVGNFVSAIRVYQDAIKCAEMNHEGETNLVKLYFSLAETYRDKEDHLNAVKWFEKELVLHKNNPVEAFKTQTIITDSMEKAKLSVDEIIDAHEKAIHLASLCRCPKKDVLAMTNKATYFRSLGLSNEPDEILKKCKALKELHSLPSEIEPDSQETECESDDSIDLNNLTSDDDNENSDDELKTSTSMKKRKVKLNEKGETPLHIAAQKGDIKTVERLLREGHNVNARDFSGWTPLHEACNFGALEVVEVLLKNGANVNDSGGEFCDRITPMHDAATNGQMDVMSVLLNYKPNILAKNLQGNFVMDELIAWKSRAVAETGTLDEETLQKYDSMKNELKSRMKQAGYIYGEKDVIRARRRRKERSISPKFGVLTGQKGEPIPIRTMIDDFDPDNPDAAVDLYSSTIQGLRQRGKRDKSQRAILSDNSESESSETEPTNKALTKSATMKRKRHSSPKHALTEGQPSVPVPIVSDDLDFENDGTALYTSRLQNHRQTQSRATDSRTRMRFRPRSKSPEECVISDVSSDQELDRETNKCNRKTAKQSKKVVEKDKDDSSGDEISVLTNFLPEMSDILLSDEYEHTLSTSQGKRKRATSEGIPRAAQNNPKRVGSDRSSIRVKVHIRGKMLLVPVSQENVTNTIDWLCGECAKRYFESSGIKPVLSLATTDGALLSGSDVIYVVLNGPEVELFANIISMDLPRLSDRFKTAASKISSFKYEEGILLALDICQSSNILNLSDYSLQFQTGQAIFQALKFQYELKDLIFSECGLQDEGLKQLAEVLPTLNCLTLLDLNCNGITSEGFESFVKSFKNRSEVPVHKQSSGLASLNLSFNPLGNSSGPLLTELLLELPRLKILSLADCDFTVRLLAESRLIEGFKKLQLDELDVSYNSLGKTGLELLHQFAFASRLICTSCIGKEQDIS